MRRRRAIIDTDAKNEADDQFAIVHALLSPSLDVRGLIAAHFGASRSTRSMEESREEIDRLLGLMNLENRVTVADGAREPIADGHTPQDSPGARLIVAESKLATPEDPLYVAFLGPLTDMASAILLDPDIVRRPVVVIWIGGVGYGGVETYPGVEFNLGNDIAAANLVFGSGIALWQVPSNIYSQVSVSYAELEEKIGGTSELADYLISQMVEWNATYWPEPIESRSLGDSPAVSLLLYPRGGGFRTVPAPRFGQEGHYLPGSGHPIRVVESIDVRFLLEDMFAKIRRFGRDHRNDRTTASATVPTTRALSTRSAHEGDWK
jgi:purine nucleosidase